MRSIILAIGFLYTSGLVCGQSTKDTISLEYLHGISLKKIPEPGNPMRFVQHCIATIDSAVSTGHISFEHSTVGKVEDCLFQYKIVQDTLRTVVIKTKKKNNTEQLINQSTEQFGNPEIKSKNSKLIYTWSYMVNDKTVNAVLVTTKNLQKSNYWVKSSSK